MMYYFFLWYDVIFNCFFLPTSSTCNVFVLLQVVLTSLDRLSIYDGSIIDGDVPR